MTIVADLPIDVDYPIIAVADLHGQRRELERLVDRLIALPEWPACAIVFLGDFVDRGPDVRGTIDLVLELLRRPAGGSATMGNHDLALVRAARLDGGEASKFWLEHYRNRYDYHTTFRSYLGETGATWEEDWERDLEALRRAMPDEHRHFLASLPWIVEAPRHIFVHCGLSPELTADPEEQVRALRAKCWDRERLGPRRGTNTAEFWSNDYPVWLGADRNLSSSPLPHPRKVQVTGHEKVYRPDANAIRIRLDTSGGFGTPTACLLASPVAPPVFLRDW
jgi:serine/threonine protein phosphatase 1